MLELRQGTFRLLDRCRSLAIENQVHIVHHVGIVQPKIVAVRVLAVVRGGVIDEKAFHQRIGAHERPEVFVENDFLLGDELRPYEEIDEMLVIHRRLCAVERVGIVVVVDAGFQ